MDSLIGLIAPIAAVGGLYVVLPVVADTYQRFRGVKQVTCPENDSVAEVRVDAAEAAASAVVGPPNLQIAHCSRWPEHHACDQRCVEQLR